MSDIIDEFIIALRLDPSNYTKESKKLRDDIEKNSDLIAKRGKEMDQGAKRSAQEFRNLRNELTQTFLAFTAANSLKGFVTDMLTGAAAVGRLADNLNMLPSRVNAWNNAVASQGGGENDGGSALSILNKAGQDLRLTGTTGMDQDLKAFGITQADLDAPERALMKFAAVSERMSKPEFVNRLQRMGIPIGVINTLELGSKRTQELIDKNERMYNLTKDQVQAAKDFDAALQNLETTIKGELSPAVTEFATEVSGLLGDTKTMNVVLPVMVGLFGALALAVGIAYWPFVVLAGAIALVASNMDTLTAAWKNYTDWYTSTSSATDSIFDPLRKALGLKTGKEARDAGTDIFGTKIGDALGTQSGSPPSNGTSSGWSGGHYNGQGGYNAAATGSNQSQIAAALKAAGISDSAAMGIMAGIYSESKFDPNAIGPKYKAYGIGQWLGTRRAQLFKKYGKNPSLANQIEFLIWELKGGNAGMAKVLKNTTADKALLSYVYDGMAPGAGGALQDMAQGRKWMARGTSGNLTIESIIVNEAVHGKHTASAVVREIDQKSVVANANSGLQ